MSRITGALVRAGFRVGRFEFFYMHRRRIEGGKRPPDPWPRLLECWRNVIESVHNDNPGEPILIGGKSMGGRVASHILTEEPREPVAGAMVFGYPFHPPGKPQQWRTHHFPALQRPLWIVQGERDAFGKRSEVSQIDWGPAPVSLHWLTAGDHDLVPTKRSGLTSDRLLAEAAAAARDFAHQCLEAGQ